MSLILPPMSSYHRPRRLLPDGGGSNDNGRAASFDKNMVIILAALLCALVCALGINSIVRCVMRCACATRMSPAADEALPPKGLRKAALSRIPVAVYGPEQGVGPTDCPICLGEFSGGDKMRVLPKCRHCFHVKCVDVWLASHSSCPTCRHSLAEDHGGEVAAEGGGRQSGHGDTTAAAEEVG